ncbi:MAG: HAD hydrolase-like protein [Clostridiales bacterium]|nr:HAD hydrolase-like protein [Clostridiales bacterium]
MYEFILFDLDGTLINSEKGISLSLLYAFDKYNISYTGDLKKFIGPSFINSFPSFLGTDEQMTDNLIKAYRENYAKSGVFQTTLYRGIKDLLVCLKQSGKKIALATTKPRHFAEIILKSKRIYNCFDFVAGSELDGSITEKDEVLRHIFSNVSLPLSKSVLIGDTIYDCDGAKKVGLDCIGVTYGFGTKDELISHGAKQTANSVKELKKILLE